MKVELRLVRQAQCSPEERRVRRVWQAPATEPGVNKPRLRHQALKRARARYAPKYRRSPATAMVSRPGSSWCSTGGMEATTHASAAVSESIRAWKPNAAQPYQNRTL